MQKENLLECLMSNQYLKCFSKLDLSTTKKENNTSNPNSKDNSLNSQKNNDLSLKL